MTNSPCGNRLTGLLQGFKPALVQALIAKRTIETLDLRILRRTAWLDPDMLVAGLLRPCHEGPASKLRSVVGFDSWEVAPKQCCSVKKTFHVMPANTKVHCAVDALVRVVAQALSGLLFEPAGYLLFRTHSTGVFDQRLKIPNELVQAKGPM